jgi:saccharopine dehydrogenase-like NADP-dependent oxidoreductase
MAVGSALDLQKDSSVERITLADVNQNSLDEARRKVKTAKVDTNKSDATDASSTALMKRYDVAIGALPHPASAPALKNAINAGLSVVDMVFEPVQLNLDDAARKAGATIVPGFGVHPGIANVFAGDAYNKLDRTVSVGIRCGGLPLDPKSPLKHRTAFNLYSAVGEYIKPAETIEDGKVKIVPPMSEIEILNHPRIGRVECFITGTGATLTKTLMGRYGLTK